MKGIMDRYSRQVLLSHIGEKGQESLKEAKVVIIGCGALGTTIAEHLTRAGVGTITIIDRDFVELDNLQRQHLFTEADVGEPKAATVKEKLQAINADIDIRGIVDDVNQGNVDHFIGGKDIVLDGTDNLNIRYLVNDACNKLKIPWVYGACVAVNGMTMTMLPEGPCLQCLLPTMPTPGSVPSCDTVGIINTLPSIVGALQSTAAIKFLVGEKLTSDLTIIDVWDKDFKTVSVSQRKDCPCCVHHTYTYLENPRDITILTGRDAVQVNPLKKNPLSLEELAENLAPRGRVKKTPYILFFSVNDKTLSIFPDGRAIIKGTNDEKEAKELYAEYILFEG